MSLSYFLQLARMAAMRGPAFSTCYMVKSHISVSSDPVWLFTADGLVYDMQLQH
jgi:hypothetical protein